MDIAIFAPNPNDYEKRFDNKILDHNIFYHRHIIDALFASPT